MKIRKPFLAAVFYAALSTTALAMFACSGDSPSSSFEPPYSSFESPSSNSNPYSPSSSSTKPTITPLQAPNAVIITLKEYVELSSLDGTGSKGDPTISFSVKTFAYGTSLATIAGKKLLDRNDIDTWSGSVSDTISINPATDSLVVLPKVLDKDALFDDDISPAGSYTLAPFINSNGTTFQSYKSIRSIVAKNSLCSITYDLTFIRK